MSPSHGDVKGRDDSRSGGVDADFVFRYPLEVRAAPTDGEDRLAAVTRALLSQLLDVVTLYDADGRDVYPVQFAFIRDRLRRDIWPRVDGQPNSGTQRSP